MSSLYISDTLVYMLYQRMFENILPGLNYSLSCSHAKLTTFFNRIHSSCLFFTLKPSSSYPYLSGRRRRPNMGVFLPWPHVHATRPTLLRYWLITDVAGSLRGDYSRLVWGRAGRPPA